ncbi:signal peptidase II [Neotabrizicola shimadae]|uniref:Lipoprotein signal peptidase n=1 Tax=Neotabrizicola shimadae TaxID=2807096 RepID=A0A8G1EBK6_9RHOB|nr:signal peptidase II [Neotabrizicola shimadae]QYZ69507.1 signal peptidase II [Neotabrizicola shimadae]
MHLLTLVALATFVLDQVTKWAVVHGMNLIEIGSIEVIPTVLAFHMAWNTGINFGLFAAEADYARWILIAIALGISAWVWLWVRREGADPRSQVFAGLLIGGAIGNVVDRVIYGAVADFLNVSCCGIENPFSFNVADAAIFVGALGLVLFPGKSAEPGKKGRKTP